jgi:hypothetical protein
MKKIFALMCVTTLGIAGLAFAQEDSRDDNKSHVAKFEAHGDASPFARRGSNLVDHGGPVMTAPKVVCIFWGFGSGNSYTSAMQSFRNSGLYNYSRMLGQYRNAGASAAKDFGGGANDKFDTSTPPAAVSDAAVQAEVRKYFGGAEDANTIYEVFIPSGSYSSDGGGTSCGGPALQYCAYHGNFSDGSRDVKYSIAPYPGCSGCQTSGFSITQNANHFTVHETREATSDPDLNAWYDRSGAEADDKCAWSPTPFIDQATGFGYQYEWSNSAGGCVKQ